MANRMDIGELLTQGLFAQPEPTSIDPRATLSSTAFLRGEGLRSQEEMGNYFGQAREFMGLLTPQEKEEKALAEELQQLNLETPEGLTRLAEIQRMTGDLEGSLQTLGALRQAEVQTEQRDAIKKYVVDTYGSQYGDLVDTGVIKDLGDLKTFIDKKPKKGIDPSMTDVKEIEMLLETAGSEAKGGEMFGFFGTDWDEAWKDLSVNKKREIATEIREEVDRLIDDGMNSSEAKRIAIQKMYTDNLTETGLLEFGESKLLSPEEREKRELQDVRDTANKLLNDPKYSSKPPK